MKFILVLFLQLILFDTALAMNCNSPFKSKIDKINSRLTDSGYKVIVLGRHGKASQKNKFTVLQRAADPKKIKLDIKRPLTNKGKKAAKKLSKVMKKLSFRNVGMWGSHALRVQNTAEHTIKVLGDKVKISKFKKDLYYANVPKMMHQKLTTRSAKDISHAFFWGHGKTTLALFKQLTGATNPFLPTAAVMIVAVKAESWDQVFRGDFEAIEGYAWSPNKSHSTGDPQVPVANLEIAGGGLETTEGILESFPAPKEPVDDSGFTEIELF